MSNINKYAVFMLNDTSFGVPVDLLDTIDRPPTFHPVPAAPDFVEGISNIRDHVYTIINLNKRFNFPVSEFSEETRILIANTANGEAGFIVDSVNEIVDVNSEDINDVPKNTPLNIKKYARQSISTGSKRIYILDTESAVVF
jgi:purine-binding chemotaxis protein CheW